MNLTVHDQASKNRNAWCCWHRPARDGHRYLKSNDYFVNSLKNPKKITIILLLLTGPPEKIAIISPQKSFD
jgi:hypothetical protein